MSVVMGIAPDHVRSWFAPQASRPMGVGLPEHPFVWAHSSLKVAPLVAALRRSADGPPRSSPASTAELGTGKLDELLALGTGSGDLAVSFDQNAKMSGAAGNGNPRARLGAVLDMFPITALAEIEEPNAFDATLPRLQTALSARGVAATLDKEHVPASLRAPALGGSEVALSRRGSVLVYGIGPGTFQHALDALTQKHGIDTKRSFLRSPHPTRAVSSSIFLRSRHSCNACRKYSSAIKTRW